MSGAADGRPGWRTESALEPSPTRSGEPTGPSLEQSSRRSGEPTGPSLEQSSRRSAEPTWRRIIADVGGELGDPQAARWIVQHASGLQASSLLAHLDEPVAPSARLRVDALVERRRSGEPLQWVLGMWGFRGVDVAVDGRALVPRPETEIVVDAALAQLALAQPALAQLALAQLALAQLGRADQPCRVADLGTGSGVIALSIAAEVPAVEVFATDASGLALSLAAENLARQEAGVRSRVRLLRGDWFGALPIELAGSLAVVVSNPPYLAADEWPELDAVVRDYDPYESLVAGATGLEVISLLIAEAPRWLRAGGSLVVEIAPHQSEAVLRLIGAMGGYASAQVLNDLAGRPRVLVASLPA